MSELNRGFEDRLKAIFREKNIRSTLFSERLGKSRATVSTYLNGKSYPGGDFFELLNEEYPEINLHWLITGKGEKYFGKSEDLNFKKQVADMIEQQGRMLQSFIALNNIAGEDPSLAKFVDVYGTGDLIIGYNTIKQQVAYC